MRIVLLVGNTDDGHTVLSEYDGRIVPRQDEHVTIDEKKYVVVDVDHDITRQVVDVFLFDEG